MFKTEQQYTIRAHDNEFGHRRSFTMYVKSPDQGINEQTGVLLVVQNLLAQANSSFWQGLRAKWADAYNVVCIGLNYQGAGWTGRAGSGEYAIPIDTIKQMCGLLPEEIRPKEVPTDAGEFLKYFIGWDLTRYGIEFTETQNLEFWKNYPDYGFIQAIDCLWALGALKQICGEKQVSLNWKRTYAYGLNEGGHIVQMCGRFAPNTFALIVDNSGYPYITLNTMTGGEVFREIRRLPAGDSYINVFVSIPKTYGLWENARYYVTEDMVEIRDLRRFIVESPTRYVVIQAEGDNPDKQVVCEMMRGRGLSVEYAVEEDAVDEHSVASLFENYADRYLAPDSSEMLLTEGVADFELGTRITFSTTNGQFVLDYSSGAPMIEFEGEIIALRLAKEEPISEGYGTGLAIEGKDYYWRRQQLDV
ncbi:MAG: DUF2920 family protein [Firmicutes bacterium]|nr:DUF2920 family protein [Bacillota bacterium]